MSCKVGIVGGGLAGLSTAKILRQFGFDVVLFEREPDIGGVWSSSRRYPGLTTQNPRETYAFSDFPMPCDYPEWPAGAEVQAYLESYVDHFGFRDAIRLDPTDPDGFQNRGLAWKAKGEAEKAAADFAEAKRLRELKK